MIILFNGPPGSGKDEAVKYLVLARKFSSASFKEELFKATIEYFGVDYNWFMDSYEDRLLKEKPERELGGLSRRQALIYVSEDIIKPKHGKSYFGEQAAKKITTDSDHCFSDSGFLEELDPIINKVGAENICLVQLLRTGCSFAGDSRRYIDVNILDEYGKQEQELPKEFFYPQKVNVRGYRIHNTSTLDAFYQAIDSIYLRELHERKNLY